MRRLLRMHWLGVCRGWSRVRVHVGIVVLAGQSLVVVKRWRRLLVVLVRLLRLVMGW